jgi:D-sedoheptulose 7-phosphate isomerase
MPARQKKDLAPPTAGRARGGGKDSARNRIGTVGYTVGARLTDPSFSRAFLAETARIANELEPESIELIAARLAAVRERGGRLFILGVGGGAGHASHAVSDFRKLCGIESYAPTDNVSELTARTNDEGWETSVEAWLRTSRVGPDDGMLVFSVSGGSRERGVSLNLVKAIELAREVGATVTAIVGRSDGMAAREADVAVVVPAPAGRVTPHTEAFQAVIWHLLVSHPALAAGASERGRSSAADDG